MNRRSLADVAEIERGTTPAKLDPTGRGALLFSQAEVSAEGRGERRFVALDLERPPIELNRGDVVIALMGRVGSALVPKEYEGALLGRECAVVRDGGLVDGRWIHAWTLSSDFRDQALRRVSGETIPRLSYRALKELTIPIPPEEVRNTIQANLGCLDEATDVTAELLTQLRELRGVEVDLAFAALGSDGLDESEERTKDFGRSDVGN